MFYLSTIIIIINLQLTFRCVIATDGNVSFAIFLYKELHWSPDYPVHVGFNNGD